MVLAQLGSRAESFTQLLTVILVFVLVLGLTYLTTLFVGSYQKTKNQNRNFEVIETCKVTNGKYLQLIKVGGKYMVIGIGKDSITGICEVPEEEIKVAPDPSTQSVETFRSILDKAKQRISKGGSNNDK